MKTMPMYDVTPIEQTLIDKIPPAVETKDPQKILSMLKELYTDEEYQDCLSAMMIIEKYLFRAYELLYFVINTDVRFQYDEYFFDEEIHNAVILEAKSKLNSAQALLDYQKGVALIKTKTYDEAGEYFKRSAFGGNVDGAFNYGVTLSRGEGCQPNALESAFWYWVAACGNNTKAMINLALCFRDGNGVCADEMTMLYWYIQAGLNGSVDAVRSIASNLMRGIGLSGLETVGQNLMVASINLSNTEKQKDVIATLSSLNTNLEPYIYNRNF